MGQENAPNDDSPLRVEPAAPTEGVPADAPGAAAGRTNPRLTLSAIVLQWFVNRERETRHFIEMLQGRDPKRILLIKGPTGIGKTWLLRRLAQEARARNVPSATINFSSANTIDTLWIFQNVAQQVGSRHFPFLSAALENATQLRVVLKVEAGGSSSVDISGSANVEGDLVGGDVIKGNRFYLSGDNPDLRQIWQQQLRQAFLSDLAAWVENQDAVLLFDSYESATQEPRTWMAEQLLAQIGEGKLANLRLVIAGEQVPPLPSLWRNLITVLGLAPLPAAEVRRYLTEKRNLVISEQVVSAIYEVTGGKPDLVALIADSPNGLPENATQAQLLEILIQGLLETVPPPLAETLRVLAIPEWFDAELLAALSGDASRAEEQFNAIVQYSFAQSDNQQAWHFSPAVRRTLLETWAHQPLKLRELHQRAAQAFAARAQSAMDPERQEEYQRQAMGHWFSVEERRGLEMLRALFSQAEATYRLTSCELLLKRVQTLAGLTQPTRAWLDYLNGRLALALDDYATSARLFQNLLGQTDLDAELEALTRWAAGQLATEQGQWANAIESYKGARRYFQAQADAARVGQLMIALGDVYLQQARTLGELIQPRLIARTGRWRVLRAIPGILSAFPFVVYAWFIRRWRFLPPLQHGMNYRNWTLMRMLFTAAEWYRRAESTLAPTGQVTLLANAQLGLAQTYHRIGWWNNARELFEKVLASPAVVANDYLEAQVQRAFADTELYAGNTDNALELLTRSYAVLTRYHDAQGQIETTILLGRAWMQKGQFERGMEYYSQSLRESEKKRDHQRIGLALDALRRSAVTAELTPLQFAHVETLIANTHEKPYFPRVPDRWASNFERGLRIGLAALGVVALYLVAAPILSNLSAPSAFATAGLKSLGYLVIAAVSFLVAASVVGLGLVVWTTKRKFEPEQLDSFLTDDDAITRYDNHQQIVNRVVWSDVAALVVVERMRNQTPSPLLSYFWIYGSATGLRVPGTILWYSALKQDVDAHLAKQNIKPARLYRNAKFLPSRLGVLFLLAPWVFMLGYAILKNFLSRLAIPLHFSADQAALLSPVILTCGLVLAIAPLYWWLFLYPLWVRYTLTPQSTLPFFVGAAGILLVAGAFALALWYPFFPFRDWLNQTLFPLGFIAVLAAALWVISAREWKSHPAAQERAVHRLPLRIGALFVLLVALLGAALFAWREWAPYVSHVLPAIARYYRSDYVGAVEAANRALAVNPGFADGYAYRGRAQIKLAQPALALQDLNLLIESGQAVPDDFIERAQAYRMVSDSKAACRDLRTALALLGSNDESTDRVKAETLLREWNCS
ncbi:MAG: AAA family ATPase [Chloroflexi bacterium]|nr:AAA family ATPase [Chloroflexota bacterium]